MLDELDDVLDELEHMLDKLDDVLDELEHMLGANSGHQIENSSNRQ